MSHEITEREDGTAEAAYVGKPAWHGLGTVVEEAMTSQEALKTAQLDWQVEKKEVQVIVPKPHYDTQEYSKNQMPKATEVMQNMPLILPADNFKATVRTDTNEILGMVSQRYVPIQNVAAFDFLDSLVESGDLKYESAGSLHNGGVVWMLARLKDEYFISDDDPCLTYMVMTNRHDGGGAAVIKPTNVRVVCWNTLQWALNEDNARIRPFRIIHNRNATQKLEEAKEALGFIRQQANSLNNILKQLSFHEPGGYEVDKFLETMFPMPTFDTEADEARRDKIRDRIDEQRGEVSAIFRDHEFQNTKAAKGTSYGLLNAYTQYIDHERSYKAPNPHERQLRRFNDSLFGDGMRNKSKALQIVREITAV